ncbi:hypothetical protein C0Q70_12791 [Pomacea canaliculata]|uniref:ABC-type glutathione-S-conjugate transporter n=1 Tax=Pomacea canaliculata TaxID=400727 RepID=A0A2T7P2G6_POMCA|nr:hypothetical protein C0Q70_12791 [Pomacea canaliculata]
MIRLLGHAVENALLVRKKHVLRVNSSFYDYNGWPRLTDCFLNTVLVWVPCACLWCPLPFYLVVLARKGEVTPLHVTWLNSAKTFSSMVLSMVALVSLIQGSKLLRDGGSDVLPVVAYLASALRLVSYIYLGWQRDLTEADLFDLNPRDSSDVLVPCFEREWELERERLRNKRNRLGNQVPRSQLLHPQFARKGRGHHSLWDPPPARGRRGEARNAVAAPSLGEARGTSAHPRAVRERGIRRDLDFMPHVIRADDRAGDQPRQQRQAGEVWLRAGGADVRGVHGQDTALQFQLMVFTTVGMQLKTILIAAIYRKIIMVVGVLYVYIGPSVFAGVIVLLLLVPLNSYISSCQKKLNISNLKFKDKRLRLTNDMLSGMRVVKMYAWEPSFEKMINDSRSEETKVLLRISYLNMFMGVFYYFAPFLVTLATFATFVVVSPDNHLDARRVFVTLALLNLLRDPLDLLAKAISLTVQSMVSVQRINKFLCCEDLDTDSVTCAADEVDAISIRNGTFTWDKHYKPVLKNVDISVGVGRLVAVVGHVGSGKSSLISSLLGETERVSGKVTMKGINLSGGQKQRVSLARAVYSDSDIYLLEDPLSAVDSHVGKHIFTEVIGPNGLLRHKTRVLVTHGIHWLPMVDEIIVLSDNGISEKGSYDTLMSHDGPFARFLKLHLQQKEDMEEEEDPEISILINKIRENVETVTSDGATSGEDLTYQDYSRRRKSTRTTSKSSWMTDSTKSKFSTCHLEEDTSLQENNYRLVKEETIEKGNVKWSVFLTYIRAAGAVPFTASILFFLLFQAINASSNFWLSRWTDDNFLATSHGNATLRHDYTAKNDYYLMVFVMFGIGQIVTLVLSNFLLCVRTVVASKNLHSRLLASVLRSPMVFFDTTPVGRIINRFSRDIDTIDNILPNNIQESVSAGTMILVTIIVISISTPLFIFLVIPVIILYFLIQSFYIPTSRQLKRMESVTHSPIYVHFSETISGGATIRAYRAVDRFIEEIKRRVDRNQSLYFTSLSAHRWMTMNLEIITNLIIFGAAICSIVTPGIGGGTLGFSVTNAMQMSEYLGWIVRMISDLITSMVSVERVKEYSQLDQRSEKGPSIAPWTNPLRRPDTSWPERGRLLFSEYSTRYRPGLDLVLRDISFIVEAGQKDPVLFSGTLRMNLDPLGQYSDDQIWKSLETAQLKVFAKFRDTFLLKTLLSSLRRRTVGQRQLVCLARSLLRRTKILVLDEATAAVDMETDSLIQNTIREAFSSCTIITIAHRLNTIMDYDRILVLDEGLVKEYDSPHVLLANKQSIFYGMAKDADLKSDMTIRSFDEFRLTTENDTGVVKNVAWFRHTMKTMMTAMLRLLIKEAAFNGKTTHRHRSTAITMVIHPEALRNPKVTPETKANRKSKRLLYVTGSICSR